MKKYKVRIYFTASDIATVLAEDEDHALKQACADFDAFPFDDTDVHVSASYIVTEEDIPNDL